MQRLLSIADAFNRFGAAAYGISLKRRRIMRGKSPFRLRRIGVSMNLNLSLTPLISLLAGILILVIPRLLNTIVAIYLIVIGLVGLFGLGAVNFR